MIEIKFRAWDTIHDKMSNTFTLLDCIGQKQAFMLPENFTFMQYTGLKDGTPWGKATPEQRQGYTEETWGGVEIFEGDIVSCDQAQDLGFKVVGVVHFGIDYRESSGWADPRIYIDTRQFEKHGSQFCIFHK